MNDVIGMNEVLKKLRNFGRNGKEVKSIEELRRILNILEKEKDKRERKYRAEEIEQRIRELKLQRKEKKNYKWKLKTAEEIFEWSAVFSLTGEHEKLLALGLADLKATPDTIRIWKDIGLRNDGAFVYRPGGYKILKFYTPKELVKHLSTEEIKEFHQFIKSGKVYEKLLSVANEELARKGQ